MVFVKNEPNYPPLTKLVASIYIYTKGHLHNSGYMLHTIV